MPCRPACATCEHLRAAALAIVGADGIEALTLERLAAEANLPSEKVRVHYPTASDCLYDTYEEVARSIYDDFAAAFTAEPGWRDALRVATKTLVRRMAARPNEARLCFAEILQGDYELLRRREASRQRLLRLFARELRRRCDYPEPVTMQLELLIGGGFQAIAGAVAEDRLLTESERLAADLESRMFVFELVAA
jgi:AcrR family transcriptional regulator